MSVQMGGDRHEVLSFGLEPHDKADNLLLLRDSHQLSVNDAVSVGRDADMSAGRLLRSVAKTAIRGAQVCAAVDQDLTEGCLGYSQLLGNLTQRLSRSVKRGRFLKNPLRTKVK